jgi:hypothetical protein
VKGPTGSWHRAAAAVGGRRLAELPHERQSAAARARRQTSSTGLFGENEEGTPKRGRVILRRTACTAYHQKIIFSFKETRIAELY